MANLKPELTFQDAKNMVRYMSVLLQTHHKDIINSIHRRDTLGTEATKTVLRDTYGFESPQVADILFRQAHDVSKGVIDKLIDTLGMDRNQFGQKTEQQIDETSIAGELRYLNQKTDKAGIHGYKQGVSQKSMFEARRKLFIEDIALRLIKQGLIDDPGGKLSDIQDHFNRFLYEGPVGFDELKIHTLKVDDTGKVAKKGKKVKFVNRMRPLYLMGNSTYVQTDFDKKTYESQILKLLCDFAPKIMDDGEISYAEFDPLGADETGRLHIHDRSRFRFIVEKSEDVEALSELIKKMRLVDGTNLFSDIDDAPQNYDRGQIKTWKKRFKAWHNGAPVEILFYDIEGYYNSTNQYGKLNGNTNLYDGADHRLFEVRRLLKILEFMFPYEIYKKNNAQTHEQYSKQLLKYAQRMSMRIAEDLMFNKDD